MPVLRPHLAWARRAGALALAALVASAARQPGESGDPSEPGGVRAGTPAVDFGRQIRPILADRCFPCHGPDAETRQADLRLDRVDEAIEAGVIEPGAAGASELVSRIEAASARSRMPPPSSRLALSQAERELLRRWIDEGAAHAEHWAFVPLPAQVAPPAVRDAAWPRGPLDTFVLARLETEGLAPSPPAERARWLRRASFDLTGLPPSPQALAAFARDERPDAYERAVDGMLGTQAWGERMAVPWLDAARYADSYGYQSDQLSPTWPYRDWVVRAFRDNMPFDRFLTWQLAGDLIEEPTRDSRLATAFNRLHRMTNEGGSIAEEWRLEGVADRVQTLGTAVLGLTLECARCHDHKFDPLTQREHYALSAAFASIDETGLYNDSGRVPTPTLLLPTPDEEARAAELSAAVEVARAALAQARAQAGERFEAWLAATPPASLLPGCTGHYPLDALGPPADAALPEAARALANLARPSAPGRTSAANRIEPGAFGAALAFSGDDGATFPDVAQGLSPCQAFTLSMWLRLPAPTQTSAEASAGAAARDERARGSDALILHQSGGTDAGYHGTELSVREGRLRFSIQRQWPGNALCVESADVPRGRWFHLAAVNEGHLTASGLSIFVDGRLSSHVVKDHLTKDPQAGGDGVVAGARFRDWGLRDGALDELRVFERALSGLEIAELAGRSDLTRALQTRDRAALLETYLAAWDAPVAAADAALRGALAASLAQRTAWLEVPVMEELSEPRPTYVLARGAYDAPRDEDARVEPGTPAVLPPLPPAQGPERRDRLRLARWLAAPDHPLTARVAVNRLWAQFFGRGLVGTIENFGAQGEAPTHPELLDWLARDFVDSGWNVAHLCREIVLSATYRQDSRADAALRQRDPENALLARGPAQRLSAEMLRDAALFVGGLLDTTLGGPPVSPYQPEGLWTESNEMSPAYRQSVGRDLYRRSLYTVWKRTAPMPNMVAFDAPLREVACARRQLTSTPLQALVLLGDVQFVEAARALAERTLGAGLERGAAIAAMFERATSRSPRADELDTLAALFDAERDAFAAAPERARALAAVGAHPVEATLDPVDVAAATVVAQAILNSDAATWKR